MTHHCWYLEGYVEGSERLRRFQIHQLPFRVGRHESSGLVLNSAQVSRHHAEIDLRAGALVVQDLASTNGTFVNHQSISEIQLRHGDIVHFGDQEFRVIEERPAVAVEEERTSIRSANLPQKLPAGARQLQELLRTGGVSAVFQPIVNAKGEPFGYEMLGRGAFEQLPTAPWPLFQIAESLDLEVPLSELFRQRGLQLAHGLGPNRRFFFNIHPRELRDPDRLLTCIEQTRLAFPSLSLVFEMHEAAATNAMLIRRIRDQLQGLGVGFAYDDFGAGQARLIELTEVPPDIVKFDIALIRDIDTAPSAKRQMLEMFQRYLLELGVATLAEGVETELEFKILQELGIQYFQGYYFGRPSANLKFD